MGPLWLICKPRTDMMNILWKEKKKKTVAHQSELSQKTM